MRKALLSALAAAPLLVAGVGVVAAQVMMHAPAIEDDYAAGAQRSSCTQAPAMQEDIWGGPTFTRGEESWRVEVHADDAACSDHGGLTECRLRAPAKVSYVSADGEHAYNIETIGEHRVRANQHGLSCRRMN